MRGLLTNLFLLLFSGFLFGQSDLLITAAYDGPLTGGVPKGLELYATGDIADLSIYGIGIANNGGGSDGKEYDFPADAVSAGTYIYWTFDAVGFELFFGFAPEYASDLANINGDDALELYKDGVVVDVFGDVENDGTGTPWEYLDGWAARNPGTGPDGATFVLGNWQFSGPNALDGTSENSTAPIPIPLKSYGGMVNPDVTIVGSNFMWSPADITIEIGQTVQFQNGGGFHNVDGSLATYPNNPEGFKNGDASTDPWIFNYTFNIEGTYDYQCNPHAAQNMVGTITVEEPVGPGYPAYSISTISSVDANGLPDSINVTAEITGIVNGIDYSGGTTAEFFLADNTGGMGAFAGSALMFNVVQGDEITLKGTVGQNNGLTRITADEIAIISSGNPIPSPTVVTNMDESTEGEFIRINNLMLMDAAQWAGDGSSFTAIATDGTTDFAIRVDSDSEVANRPAPPGAFDIIGLGSQFDQASPYDEGYQILPRVNADVILQGGDFPVAGDDVLNLAINENGAINVVLNDFVPGQFDQITLIGSATLGQATVSDSTINYFPFQDECGQDIFEYSLCNTGGLCDTAMVTVNIACPPTYPEYDISVVTTNDMNGVPDSFEIDCALRGIVYGVNLRPGGLLFTIIDKDDPNAGIAIFSDDQDFGYTVTEGDEILVQGQINQFFGLTQIVIEGVSVVSTDNSLGNPAEVTALGEDTESKFIRIPDLTIVDAADWDNMGSGMNVTLTDGTNEYTMRVDADTDIFGTAVPTATFNLTGIGGQFDAEDPLTEGYQILPRRLTDLDFGSDVEEIQDFEALIHLFPNPTTGWVQVETGMIWEKITVFDSMGKSVKILNNQGNQLFLGDLAPGMYNLLFQNETASGNKKIQILK